MQLRNTVIYLLVAVIVTPMATVVLAALATLLSWLGDHGAAQVMTWVTVGLGAIWVLQLLMLLLAVTVGYSLREDWTGAADHSADKERANQEARKKR